MIMVLFHCVCGWPQLREREIQKRDDPANAENRENALAEIALWDETLGAVAASGDE